MAADNKTCKYCYGVFKGHNVLPLFFQVLDAGQIHAYAEPYTLLQDQGGIFYKMVQQTGKQEAAALLEAAKQVRSFSSSNASEAHALVCDWSGGQSRPSSINSSPTLPPQAYNNRPPSNSNTHADTADGNLVIFETALWAPFSAAPPRHVTKCLRTCRPLQKPRIFALNLRYLGTQCCNNWHTSYLSHTSNSRLLVQKLDLKLSALFQVYSTLYIC